MKKSCGTVRLKASIFIEDPPEGALMLIALDGTETEQAADGALTEQCTAGENRPFDGNEPIVARNGDGERLRQRGFNVTERAAEAGISKEVRRRVTSSPTAVDARRMLCPQLFTSSVKVRRSGTVPLSLILRLSKVIPALPARMWLPSSRVMLLLFPILFFSSCRTMLAIWFSHSCRAGLRKVSSSRLSSV